MFLLCFQVGCVNCDDPAELCRQQRRPQHCERAHPPLGSLQSRARTGTINILYKMTQITLCTGVTGVFFPSLGIAPTLDFLHMCRSHQVGNPIASWMLLNWIYARWQCKSGNCLNTFSPVAKYVALQQMSLSQTRHLPTGYEFLNSSAQ